MKTIGKFLKEERVKKSISLFWLEKETKIKRTFIEKIEKDDWLNLPPFPVVSGFIQNIADILGIPRERALALLRRDYSPKPVSINPKPDISQKKFWSPTLTLIFSIGALLLLAGGYLGFQYFKFVSPPALVVDSPKEEEVVTKKNLIVSGKTDVDAIVTVNFQQTIVDQNGKFVAEIEIFEGTKEILVTAKSRSGKETTLRRKINVDLK